MSAQATRLLKEGRTIFWPWCAVIVAAVAMAVPIPAVSLYAGLLGFCAGIPLLAAVSWGIEFEQRTLALLLSQGVDRAAIWSEKVLVLIAAAAPAGLLYWFAASLVDPYNLELWVIAGTSVMITICSATFWTLVGRSTIGGVVLNALQLILLLAAIGIATGFQLEYSASAGMLLAVDLAGGCYSFAMLWLGRRRLAVFQSTGGISEGDILAGTPNAIRETWNGLLRSRPNGALANMVRKEIHFLWPLWMMTLLFLAFSVGFAAFESVLVTADPMWLRIAAIIILVYGSVAPVIAGTVSMGEERTLGTYPWHTTLPLSSNRQWFVKLAVAAVSSFLCVNLVFNSSRILLGPKFAAELGYSNNLETTKVWGICVLAFWCACAVRGTVRAIFWFFPVVGALGATVFLTGGFLFGPLFGNSRSSFANGTNPVASLVHTLVTRFHPYIFDVGRDGRVLFLFRDRGEQLLFGLFAAFIIIQSLSLFRTETRQSIRQLLRCLLPLIVGASLCVALPALPLVVVSSAHRLTSNVIREVQTAVARIPLDQSKTAPYPVTLEDLSKVSSISDHARRWLGQSTITIVPKTFTLNRYIGGKPVPATYSYYTTVQLQREKCTFFGARDYFLCSLPTDRFQYDKTLDQLAIDQAK